MPHINHRRGETRKSVHRNHARYWGSGTKRWIQMFLNRKHRREEAQWMHHVFKYDGYPDHYERYEPREDPGIMWLLY